MGISVEWEEATCCRARVLNSGHGPDGQVVDDHALLLAGWSAGGYAVTGSLDELAALAVRIVAAVQGAQEEEGDSERITGRADGRDGDPNDGRGLSI